MWYSARVAIIAGLLIPLPAVAAPYYGNDAEIDVTYSGVVSSGNDATGFFGTTGSLVGQTVTVTFGYDLTKATSYTTSSSGSSLTSFYPGSGLAQSYWTIAFTGGVHNTIGAAFTATDAATAGGTTQSATLDLPQYLETFSFLGSVNNPAILASIIQNTSLQNIPLSLAFNLQDGRTGFDGFNVTGDVTFGNFSVQHYPEVQVTPLPNTMALFAGGLGGLLIVFTLRKRQSSVDRDLPSSPA